MVVSGPDNVSEDSGADRSAGRIDGADVNRQPERTPSAEHPGDDATPPGPAAGLHLESESVYDLLRRIAARQLQAHAGQRRAGDLTLQPTAIVNEAYLKLANASNLEVRDKSHFLSLAAAAMRQVLIDYARTQSRDKRGGNWKRVAVDAELLGDREVSPEPPALIVDVLALDEALKTLAAQDERAAEVVNLRFFAGMTERAIAEHLGVSERTVRNEWRSARAWLQVQLRPGGGTG